MFLMRILRFMIGIVKRPSVELLLMLTILSDSLDII
ncbi:unnamed protein product [Trichobilharzia regenti]|nr:unnamed protein product [Trichobilharzia regenti]